MFHVQKSTRIRTERIGSTLAFMLMLACWVAGYAVLVPADPIQHHQHVARLVR